MDRNSFVISAATRLVIAPTSEGISGSTLERSLMPAPIVITGPLRAIM